jgi:diaminopropionate ammonia-lyase
MHITPNPYRGAGLDHPALADMPFPLASGAAVTSLLSRCPRAAVTPLHRADALASRLGLRTLYIKDERARMGLGSFKALGAAHVIARDAQAGKARGATYIAASAGNHGLSVAAGAAAFGARAVIYLSHTVPEAFAARLRAQGADVVRAGDVYEDSMKAAEEAARKGAGILLSDSSWSGYSEPPHVLMEGYLALMEEVYDQIPEVPDLVMLQAGVGGLAGAAAAGLRVRWGHGPMVCVVEPEAAPALAASIAAGAPLDTEGPVSAMGRLDCKTPSLIAIKGLARDADRFLLISEQEGQAGADMAALGGFESTPSGAAGLSALLAAEPDARAELGITSSQSALIILSEGPA